MKKKEEVILSAICEIRVNLTARDKMTIIQDVIEADMTIGQMIEFVKALVEMIWSKNPGRGVMTPSSIHRIDGSAPSSHPLIRITERPMTRSSTTRP